MDNPNQPIPTIKQQQRIQQDSQSYEMLINVFADIVIENITVSDLDEVEKLNDNE